MDTKNKFASLMKAATLIETREQRSVLLSFLMIFILMAAYYMLRPVRDAMASDWTNTEISVLWNIQFVLSLAVVAFYGVAVARFKFKYLVPAVYGFFAFSFVSFHFGSSFVDDPVLLDKGFYLWVSLFSLFHVSVFWSLMADLFSGEQSGRLFGFIAVGASAGAILGPLIAAIIVQTIGSNALMLSASVLLLVPVPLIFYLQRLKITELANDNVAVDPDSLKIGGNPLAGFKQFVSSPYLIGIAAFILLYTAIGSFAYFEQTNLLRDFDRDQRTEILALLALTVNILTFVLGFFATSRLTTRWGMPTTLAVVPVFMCAALLVLAFAPILTVLLALQVARQAGNYGITRPAREMLFTKVSRESRFKAKPVVDVAIYRGGDAVWGAAFAVLTDGVGLGMAAMAAIGAGIAAVWAGLGVFLGSMFSRRDTPVSTVVADDEKSILDVATT
ncbi:MAG: MFS transporter [Gammaproteobacteria bacterium]|jgi:AAA family ATP:ADP antiporter|nr:MFS transporter [Gammaproteobacteria bacterium]MDP6095941.1 MFS transporter [Gammaproteobacteria bacterium]HJO12739.1 MFS transporter [Gammaproteobacteria bacterium]|tara:strand:- start:270 stop:1607 length:1338 start_codon:yes stop_codon:yes gene_type:complete